MRAGRRSVARVGIVRESWKEPLFENRISITSPAEGLMQPKSQAESALSNGENQTQAITESNVLEAKGVGPT